MHLSLLDECRGRVERALSSLRPDSTRGTRHEMQLYAALGASLIYIKGSTPETGAAWANALEIAGKLGDTDAQLRAFRGLWAYHMNSGEYRTSLNFARRFCGVAADRADPADLLVGDRMIGTSLHYLETRLMHGFTSSACLPVISPLFIGRIRSAFSLTSGLRRALRLRGSSGSRVSGPGHAHRPKRWERRSSNRSCASLCNAGRRSVPNRSFS